jgi:hypothetical protein
MNMDKGDIWRERDLLVQACAHFIPFFLCVRRCSCWGSPSRWGAPRVTWTPRARRRPPQPLPPRCRPSRHASVLCCSFFPALRYQTCCFHVAVCSAAALAACSLVKGFACERPRRARDVHMAWEHAGWGYGGNGIPAGARQSRRAAAARPARRRCPASCGGLPRRCLHDGRAGRGAASAGHACGGCAAAPAPAGAFSHAVAHQADGGMHAQSLSTPYNPHPCWAESLSAAKF